MALKTSLLLSLLLLGACGSASDRLLGSWEMDIATLNLSPTFREMDQVSREYTLRETRWNLEFTKDKLKWDHAMWGWGSEQWEAKYKIYSHDGNRVTVDVGITKITFTVTDDRLRFGYKGRPILLRRKKKK